MRIERIGKTKNVLGEGPLWDAEGKVLYWIDSIGAAIHRLDPASGEERAWTLPSAVGSMALRARGGAVVAMGPSFHFFDFATGECRAVATPAAGETRTRLNDGKVDRQGRFLAGTLVIPDKGGSEPLGVLYRLNPDLSVERLEDGILVSNGPCFSPDGRTFYFADSGHFAISAYDYDTATGRISNKRQHIDLKAIGSRPDGATVDAEGCLWSALVLTGQIGRFTPDGRLDRLIDMPVKHPSSVMFGGPNLDVLYVTSISRSLRHADPAPEAGGLFAITGLGVRGLPEPRFAG